MCGNAFTQSRGNEEKVERKHYIVPRTLKCAPVLCFRPRGLFNLLKLSV